MINAVGYSLSTLHSGVSGMIPLPVPNVMARNILYSSGGTLLLSGVSGVVGIGVPGDAPLLIEGAGPLFMTGGGATVSVGLLSYLSTVPGTTSTP